MPLKFLALKKIKSDSNLRAKLMLVDSKSEYTIKRWIENPEDDNLTMPKYTSVISNHTGMKLNDIVEDAVK